MTTLFFAKIQNCYYKPEHKKKKLMQINYRNNICICVIIHHSQNEMLVYSIFKENIFLSCIHTYFILSYHKCIPIFYYGFFERKIFQSVLFVQCRKKKNEKHQIPNIQPYIWACEMNYYV